MKKITKLMMAIAFAITMFAAAPQSAVAEMKEHKVVLHLDDKDPKRMNMVLNNVKNVRKYYDAKGEKVIIEVVAYGPGLHMLRADTSPVADRIAKMTLEIDNLQFSACGNTHRGMSKKAGKKIELIEEATMVPSGVVQLIALQEEGYSYVRP